ncbi:ExbD/TolR family protein [Bdellovibrio sp. HCB337]|uniref:ExbD/TolR family protein n=1 Tax=Bdellovibrio sp. HCB337 TaxID=3394358 RepID=UPI0039A73553
MAIQRPGERYRYHNILKKSKGKRGVTAMLSLTAMVDMFTVLVIFLLQNYNTTGEVLYIPKEVVLPKAQNVKELKPAFVVTISNKEVLLDKTRVATFDEVKGNEEWMIKSLYEPLKAALDKAKNERELSLRGKAKSVVDTARGQEEPDENQWRKITIQSDKDVDFLTVKKVMFTVTEAGAGEINFAVMKRTNEPTSN